MRIDYKTIKSLTVETESGVKLGKVSDLEIDVDGQTVVAYKVKGGLFGEELIISRSQVVKFTKEKMVVEDSLTQERGEVKKESTQSSPEPVAMRK